jgi:hypothetical protein
MEPIGILVFFTMKHSSAENISCVSEIKHSRNSYLELSVGLSLDFSDEITSSLLLFMGCRKRLLTARVAIIRDKEYPNYQSRLAVIRR